MIYTRNEVHELLRDKHDINIGYIGNLWFIYCDDITLGTRKTQDAALVAAIHIAFPDKEVTLTQEEVELT